MVPKITLDFDFFRMHLHRMFKDDKLQEFFMAGTCDDQTIMIDLAENKAYKMTWTKEAFEDASDKLGNKSPQDIKDWYEQVKESSQDFFFSIEDGKLQWKKGGKIKLRIAEFPLEILDVCVAHQMIFETSLKAIQEKNTFQKNFERLSEERKEYQLKMKRMIEEKENLEQKLLSRFLRILNSKQDKIKELMENQRPEEELDQSVHHDISDSSSSEAEEKNSTLDMNNSQNLLNL